ncbi:hypothetical protein OOK41_09070 [Micromonospora sp. NBC_01655]|uniref:hypothetical protein n=1 Tax=Micromonospora sp. NBC_01655 TaxID=2975983 RepID=UPI00224FB4C8|nr:hypothetical protein [Micromonospora sp. NBC_01655]MCX4470456.1 hypothetical protein [Micromonospora sp. NBC_01655]
MANGYFTALAEGLMDGSIDLDTATVKVALVRGYTFSAAHRFVSDVTGTGGTINGTSAALASKTVTGGVFDADDTTISATTNATNHGLLLFQASAAAGGADVAATAQRLIAWYDTGTGLPVQPGTGMVTVTWPNTSPRILKVG